MNPVGGGAFLAPDGLAGADPDTLEVGAVEDLPLAYRPGNARRVRTKALGDIVSSRASDQATAAVCAIRHRDRPTPA